MDDLVHRVARAWASMDGNIEDFDKGRADPEWDIESGIGRYAGYMADAEELIRRAEIKEAAK